ncbi:MAG: DUF1015 family protein [Candidatus Cloacimonadota bacterium]|nr:DUF1015 family protein [Candidatus Cloacimonadota bacterium]
MPNIKPFKGIRPDKRYAIQVAAPPYDVINSDEARELTKNNAKSYLHVSKPEIDLPKDVNLYDKKVYQKGKENLQKFIQDGILIQDKKPCLYIYRQIMGEHEQTGIVAAASVEDYNNKIIKIHEYTRADKEKDRTTHVNTLNANTGPVFLTYHAKDSINSIVESKKANSEPLYDFTSNDRIRHTIWKLDDNEKILELQNEFKNLDCLYISDGHHRSASAANVQKIRMENNTNHTGSEEYNFFLSVIFPDEQMYIMDYNRVVVDLSENTISEFLEKLKYKFVVQEQNSHFKPDKKHLFGMYLNGKWYSLQAKENSFEKSDPVKSLDVSILYENLLKPILAIGDPRKDNRINFVGGIRGLEELEKLVNSGKYKVAFALYPTSIDDLMSVADADKVMPPKSTWFEPKLRSGLITHLL